MLRLYLNKKGKTGKAGAGGTNDVELMVLLKHLSNFWKTIEMSLINCKINLILTWSANCVLPNNKKNSK